MIRKTLMVAAVPMAALMGMLPVACNNPSSGTGSPSAPSASVAPASTPAAAEATASASAAPVAARPRPDRRPGMTGMFFHASRDLDLKAEQRAAVDKLEEPLRTENAEAKAERAVFQTELIAGIRAGKVDLTKSKAHYAVFDKAEQAHLDTEAEAMTGLYKVLDPSQRKLLVASIRTKQAEREAKMKAKAPEAPASADGAMPEFLKKHLEHMTKELDLDAAQQKSVGALLAKNEPPKDKMTAMKTEGKKRMDALLVAFEGDSFDPKKLDPSPFVAKTGHEMADHKAQLMAQLVPILKPEQREAMATKMERPPVGRGHGGMNAAGGHFTMPFEEMRDEGGEE